MKNLFTPNKNLTSPIEQSADFVELFFDLVFVYAITRITFLTAHHLDPKHVLQSALIFWLIWWAWTQFTWALNAANTKIAEVRLMVLIATGVAFVMASSVDYAFKDGVLWFVVPYVLVRLIGIALYLRVTNDSNGQRSAVIGFASVSIAGLLAVIAGAFVDPNLRVYLWISVIVFDMSAVFIGAKSENWNMLPKHFAERHGLIIIIALGESLIVAASALIGQERTLDIIIVGSLAVIITCLLWWSYFSWVSEYLEEHFAKKSGEDQASAGRDTYSLMHFLIICGIIGVAVGFEKILLHPHDSLTIPVALALGGGYMFFVGFGAGAVLRMGNLILIPRLVILLISAVGIAFSVGQSPAISLGIIAASLLLINFIEWNKCNDH